MLASLLSEIMYLIVTVEKKISYDVLKNILTNFEICAAYK